MALILTTKTKCRPGFIGVEKLTLGYAMLTSLIIFLFYSLIDESTYLLGQRALIVAGILLMRYIYKRRPCRLTLFFRSVYPLALLGYWYPDTYHFSSLFPNIDHLFAQMDQLIFGSQPSLTLPGILDGKFWCELFNMGYYSYYFMIAIVPVYTFFYRYRRFEKTAFIIVCSFFLFYLVYLFVPVTGPQYYFQAIGLQMAESGHFPAIGDWFRYHTELLPKTQHGGIFQSLVEAAQSSGERPTAAFPSSHVGMSTILIILAYKCKHALFYLFLPFYVLLCIATVYIQAHYAVDVLGGWIAAFLFYKLSHYLYYRRTFHRPHGYRDF